MECAVSGEADNVLITVFLLWIDCFRNKISKLLRLKSRS